MIFDRRQILATAALAVVGMVALAAPEIWWLRLAAAVVGFIYLVAFPATTLALMLLTLSWDQLLTVRVGESATLRLAHLCAGVLFLRMLLQRIRSAEGIRLARPLVAPLALYFGGAAVSIGLGIGTSKSLGYLAWGLFDAIALFSVLLEAAGTEAGFRRVVRLWLMGAAINAGFGLLQLGFGLMHRPAPLVQQMLGEFPRINGFNYEPAYFALYLLSVGAVLLGRWLAEPKGAGRGVLLAGALFGTAALSMSRSGWLGLALLALLALGVLLWKGRTRELWRAGGLVAGVGVAAVIMLPRGFLDRAPAMAAMAFDRHEASSTAPRLGMMEQAWRVFERNPVMGVGLGGYAGYIAQHPELEVPGAAQEAGRTVTTNLWLEIAAEGGVVGLFAILWAIAATLRALIRVSREPGPMRYWALGFLLSIGLVFAVLYQFNQTLWRLDVWTLLALGWATVSRVSRSAPSSELPATRDAGGSSPAPSSPELAGLAQPASLQLP